jgi:glucan 1,3-beta-glucosidase
MLIMAIGAAVAIPLVILHKKSGSSNSQGPNSGEPQSTGATSGGNGSVVTTNNGSTFYFINNFGGEWAYDPKSPFALGGMAQSWSPRIGSEDWVWGTHIARGVNLG